MPFGLSGAVAEPSVRGHSRYDVGCRWSSHDRAGLVRVLRRLESRFGEVISRSPSKWSAVRRSGGEKPWR